MGRGDLGGKTEGLIPAAEFTDTEIPRPEPNSTIEVQRTGEHKDGFTILSYLKVLRRRTWEKIEAAFKAKETLTGKWWIASRAASWWISGACVPAGLAVHLRRRRTWTPGGTEVQVRVTKLNRRRATSW